MHAGRDWSEDCKQRVQAAGSDCAETVARRAATAARMVNFMIVNGRVWERSKEEVVIGGMDSERESEEEKNKKKKKRK